MRQGRFERTVVACALCAGLSAGAGELNVLGWWGLPPNMVSVERFREAKEAGFTALMEDVPSEMIGRALDCAQAAGIRLLLRSAGLEKDTEDVVTKYRAHPALLAWYLRDEPNVQKFPEIGELAKRIRALDDRHPCYVNLSPVSDNPESRARYVGTEDYHDYLNWAVRDIGLAFISIDHYPCRRLPHSEDRPYAVAGGPLKLSETWFENLEIARDCAATNGVPLWLFALCTAHAAGDYDYPIPTRESLRLQTYVNLAYGAQTIQYFTYYTPTPRHPMWFHHGCIERDGSRGLAFDLVRSMNLELHRRFDQFVGATSVAVWHADPLPKGTRPLGALPAFVRKLDVRGPAVIAVLKKDGADVLMVVNRSPNEPLLMTVDLAPDVRRVTEEGSLEPINRNGNLYRLDPGYAEIFRSGPPFR